MNYIDLMDDAEKEHIRSELNTYLSKKERRKKYVGKYIGNYYYKIKNKGFDNYEFIGRYLIDDVYIEKR